MKRVIKAMSEVQQMSYQDVFSEIKRAVLKHDERRLRELSRSSFYDRAMSEIRKRMGIAASEDIFASSFKKIDGYDFTKELLSELKQALPKKCSPRDTSNHYGYQIELENMTDKLLIRTTSECLNKMGYTVFFDIGVVEDLATSKTTIIAAVDEATDAWVELYLNWFSSDNDALISIDANQGNVALEDWYEED